MHKMNRHLTFLKAFINDFETVGSAWPSSESLVQEMTATLSKNEEQKRAILEIGAGTGVITERILSLLKPHETLDIVEINHTFADELDQLINRLGKSHQAKVHRKGIETFNPQKTYTHIISSLPLTNFSVNLVLDIYEQLEKLLDKNGLLTYFEYRGLEARLAYCRLFEKKHYERLYAIKEIKETFLKKREYKMRSIFSNFPPAKVFHVN